MPKFKTSNRNKIGAINTASLPDIVFMLLFFFMTVTVLREEIGRASWRGRVC